MEDVGRVQPRDDRAPVGNPLDQAALLQRRERLAYLCPRDAELNRELQFTELGAGGGFMPRNALAQGLDQLPGAVEALLIGPAASDMRFCTRRLAYRFFRRTLSFAHDGPRILFVRSADTIFQVTFM